MYPNKSILFVVRGNNTLPSCRFRAYNYQSYLESLGIKVDFLIVEKSKNIFKQILFYTKLPFIGRKHGAVIYQKLTEPLRISLISLFNKNVYYDFDDAMYISEGPFKFALTMKAAPKIIAGNTILQSHAEKYNRNCTIIPTVIEIPPEEHLADYAAPNDTVTLSWIGTSGNLKYLEPIYAAISELITQYPNIRLHVVSENISSVPKHDWIQSELWNFEIEYNALSQCTIGLMPLHDDVWSQGKCACKALQYLSFGKPVITSPVGLNKTIFENEEFGRNATTTEEWKCAIEHYVTHSSHLDEEGRAGYTFVKNNYDISTWAQTLADTVLKN